MEYVFGLSAITLVFLSSTVFSFYKKYRLLNKNLIKQSFALTMAVGEYHMWVKDHLENYLTQQVMNNDAFLKFAKENGLPIIAFESHLRDAMIAASGYIKIQSDICLRKVSEPLADDINAILEKQ